MDRLILVIALLLAGLAGCAECEQGETLCRGSLVQVCSSEERWEPLMECAEVEGGGSPWACCADPDAGGVTCLPEAECAGGEA